MELYRYTDFLTESKLTILLESNMYYSDRFVEILSKIESPIAKNILSIKGKDVDVPTNYIDISKESDTIAFTPDNRVKVSEVKKVINRNVCYEVLTKNAHTSGLYDILEEKVPELGQKGKIIKIFTIEELNKIFKTSSWGAIMNDGGNIVLFRFTDEGGEFDIIMRSVGLEDDYSNLPKSEIKIGRFARRLLDRAGFKVSDKYIEEFVNMFISRIEIEKDVFRLFSIVKGKEIKRWYYEKSYKESRGGTLNSSCMRYEMCQDFFNIYTENPEQVSLVILKEESDTNKIRGRALLWNDDKGRKFLDRIYYTKDSDVDLFKQYAIKNRWCYKQSQENSELTNIVLDGKVLTGSARIIKVTLSQKGQYEQYPYLDTLKFYTPSTGILSNSDTYDFKYKLEDTEGGNGNCPSCDSTGRLTCPSCSGSREETCGKCNGSGKINDKYTGLSNTEECNRCGGSGKLECSECNGRGDVQCYDC